MNDQGGMDLVNVVDDELLPEDAENVHDSPMQTREDGSENADIETVLRARLAAVCIDTRHSRLPLPSDHDYEENDYELWLFLSLAVDTAHESDVCRRVRLGLLKLDISRLDQLQPSEQQVIQELRRKLEIAKQEAVKRIPLRHRNSVTNFQISYQEFPEIMQLAMIQRFSPTIVAINVSDLRYGTTGSTENCQVLDTHAAFSLYQTLLDFSTPHKQSLQTILESASQSSLKESRWVMAFSRYPQEFPHWLHDQLVSLKAASVQFQLVLMVLTDAAPTGWEQMDILFSSSLQSKQLVGFQRQEVVLSPNCMIFMQTGASPSKLLKKIKCVCIDTLFGGEASPREAFTWRPSLLSTFQSGQRMVFDFQKDDAAKTQSAMALLADLHGAEAAPYKYRSWGDSANAKRNAGHLWFPDNCGELERQAILERVRTFLLTQQLPSVLVGWEYLWKLYEDVFLVTFDDVSWASDEALRSIFVETMLVSKFKAIVRVAPQHALSSVRNAMILYNKYHNSKFRKLLNHEGALLWQELSQPTAPSGNGGAALKAEYSKDIGIQIPGMSKKALNSMLRHLAAQSQSSMVQNGFDFGGSSINIAVKPGNQVCFQFHSIALARAFFYMFDEYHWEGSDGRTVVINARHKDFQKEKCHPAVRKLLAQNSQVTPQLMKTVLEAAQMLHVPSCPPGLSAVPLPARGTAAAAS